MYVAAQYPQPINQQPGGILASAIRDALINRSFLAYLREIAPAPRKSISTTSGGKGIRQPRKRAPAKAEAGSFSMLDAAMRAITIQRVRDEAGGHKPHRKGNTDKNRAACEPFTTVIEKAKAGRKVTRWRAE